MSLSPDATGPVLILSHLWDLLLVLFLLAMAFSLGGWALKRAKLALDDPLATLAFGTVTGMGLLGTALLVLGALRLLAPWSVWGLPLVAAVVGWKELLALPGLIAGIPRFLGRQDGSKSALAWGGVVLGGVALFLLTFGASPPVDWDSLMYHLPIPTLFLEEGRVLLPPDNLHVSFVGLLHMLYLPLLAAGGTSGPALLNGLLAILLGLTVYSLGLRVFDGEVGSIGMGLLWGTTTLLLVAITPRTDVTLALFLILAHFAFLLALDDPSQEGWPILGAVLVGFAAGVKLNGMAYGVGLAPLALWVAWRRGGVAPALKLGTAMAGAGLVALAPWLAKNWALLGAPLYPYFADRMVEPWLQTLYQNNPASLAPDPTLSQTLRGVRDPVSLWGVFFYPGSLTAELEGAFYYLNRIFLLLPLTLIFFLKKRLAWVVLPPILYLAVILVPFPSTNLRYLVPAVPALTIGMAFVLLEIGRRYLPRRLASVGVLLLSSWALLPSARAMVQWVQGTEAVSHLLGATSAEDFWARHHDPGVRALLPVVQQVNSSVPTGSQVLLLFEARGFPFRPDMIQDNKITNWPYLAGALGGVSCGEEVGADFLLLSRAAVTYYRLRGLEPERLAWDSFEEFSARCLTLEFQSPGYELYRWEGP